MFARQDGSKVAKKHPMNLPVFAPGCGVWVQMYTF